MNRIFGRMRQKSFIEALGLGPGSDSGSIKHHAELSTVFEPLRIENSSWTSFGWGKNVKW